MAATYYQRGESLDYMNGMQEKISAGDVVVIGDRIAVAGCDMAPGAKGAVEVAGVFKFKKTGTAAIDMGKTVYFDGTGITNSSSGNTAAGFAAAAAAAADTEILVKIG